MEGKLISQGAEAKIYLVTSPSPQVSKSHTPNDTEQQGITKATKSQGGASRPKDKRTKFAKFDEVAKNIIERSSTILKSRLPKSYRHPQLDKQIRTRRTKSEAKILTKALKAGAKVPKVLNTSQFEIQIEFINGDRLSETLNSYPEKKQFQIMKELGHQTAILHKNNIIHGDLTTSNVILAEDSQRSQDLRSEASTKRVGEQFAIVKSRNKQLQIVSKTTKELLGGSTCDRKSPKPVDTEQFAFSNFPSTSTIFRECKLRAKAQGITKSCEARREARGDQSINERSSTIYIIDFGLGFISSKQEDKAVDLHLIKQALEAKHYQNHTELFKNFCKGYIWQDSKKILERLEVVEKRGRYKH